MLEDATTHLNEAIVCCENAEADIENLDFDDDEIDHPCISSLSIRESLEDVEKTILQIRLILDNEEGVDNDE